VKGIIQFTVLTTSDKCVAAVGTDMESKIDIFQKQLLLKAHKSLAVLVENACDFNGTLVLKVMKIEEELCGNLK
jgi:hypothetical protein